MSEPFLGEIKIISWNYPPKGWTFCNGQFLPINQNQALFSLLGTMYGGNGQTNFALPDLRGRVPLHVGSGFTQGTAAGQEFHTVTQSEMPAHNHFVSALNGTATSEVPTGNFLATNAAALYNTTPNTTLLPSTISNVGGSQPHENRQPYIVLNYIIALQGIFPSRN
jgi:microcystin-dependent protein